MSEETGTPGRVEAQAYKADPVNTESPTPNHQDAEKQLNAELLITQQALVVDMNNGVSNVKHFGATGDGVTDDTAAIQLALNGGGTILFPDDSVYIVTSTLTFVELTTIQFGSARIKYNTGATPLFLVDTIDNIVFKNGHFLQGTASAWFKAIGSGTGVAGGTTYARQITLDNCWVESGTTDICIDLSDSVRQVYISNCHLQCKGGITITNKVVEVQITNCFIFGNSVTTHGIKSTAPAGGSANPEGLLITNSHIDFFDDCFIIGDMYAMTVNNCFIGGTNKSVEYIEPGTAGAGLSSHLWTGCVFATGLTVGSFTGGRPLQFQWVGCEFQNTVIDAITFDGNATKCSVRACNFSANAGLVGVRIKTNVSAISVTDNYFDSTHANGVVLEAGVGNDIVIKDNASPVANLASISRPAISKNNGLTTDISSAALSGSPTDTNEFTGAVGFQWAAGDKGLLVVNLNYTSTSAGDLTLNPNSANITAPGGDVFLLPIATNGTVSFSVPIEVVGDINGNITLTNDTGAAVTANAGSKISYVKL